MNVLAIVIFLTHTALAGNLFRVQRKAEPVINNLFTLNGVSYEGKSLSQGQSVYILEFEKKVGVVFPKKLKFLTPLVLKDELFATKIKSNSKKVVYRFTYDSNTLDKMLIRAEFKLEAEKVFLFSVNSIYNPTGEESSYFILVDQKVEEVPAQIIGWHENKILVFSKERPTNILVSHRSSLFSGRILNQREVQYE